VPLFHADIAVAGSEDLIPIIDLIEQVFRSGTEGDDFVFPCFQRALADGGVVGGADAPEEAEEFVVVVEVVSGGEESGELAGAVDDLVEVFGGKAVVVFSDEPMGAPSVAVVVVFSEKETTHGGTGTIRDEEEVEVLSVDLPVV
jgi:hypothetical protein